MANRTVKFMGYSSSASVDVVFVFNGTEVFNGTVSSDGTIGSLFTFDIDRTLDGDVNGTVSVSGGDLTIVALNANHEVNAHAELTNLDGSIIPEMTEEQGESTYTWFDSAANTSKKNITIDGVPYHKGDVDNLPGAWHIGITDGQSMVCDWVVNSTTQF